MDNNEKCFTRGTSKRNTKEDISKYIDEDTDEELERIVEEEFTKLEDALDSLESRLEGLSFQTSLESNSDQTPMSASPPLQSQPPRKRKSTPTTAIQTPDNPQDILWDIIRILRIIQTLL